MVEVIPHESNFNQVQTSERENIYFPISAICHAIVGGLWQNKKGHDASRHNSARGEKYIMKKAWKRRVKEKRRRREKAPGMRARDVSVRFVLSEAAVGTDR